MLYQAIVVMLTLAIVVLLTVLLHKVLRLEAHVKRFSQLICLKLQGEIDVLHSKGEQIERE